MTQATQDDSDSDDASANGSDSGSDASPVALTQSLSTQNIAVKKLVRLALASEYSRQPIRRSDISQKVLGEGSRQFKHVFGEAQKVLRERFGMQMVELPMKEKLTISQRRGRHIINPDTYDFHTNTTRVAAQRAEKPSTTSKSYILTTTLPAPYRTPSILPPSRAPSTSTESTHTAIYTFLISLIMLSGGSIHESRLMRSLRRVNADTYTPLDRTDRYLARLCKEGYLVKKRDVEGGEEVIEYLVGPRGRVEVGVAGVGGLVREVYGFGLEGTEEGGGNNREDKEEFEKRLKRSLGIREVRREREEDNPEGAGSSRMGRRAYDEDDEDDD